ncbi:MAG: DUF1559 domain-containing protein [Planctomycetales bacterium]|nr:DUF1559 domain-containing protein [Planctomycetales bacterium]
MNRKRMTRRAAFTLVELLVVIAIIAILVLLLLPAINSAREAARRNTCLKNAKELALAVLNHESSYQRLPLANSAPPRSGPRSNLGRIEPGNVAGEPYYYEGDGINRNSDGYSWIVSILPYIEEQPLHDQMSKATDNFRRLAFDPTLLLNSSIPESHLSSAKLELLRCPSFAGEETDQSESHYGLSSDTDIAGGNYVAVAGTLYDSRQGVMDHDSRYGGAIVSKATDKFKGVRMADIVDGASKTILMGESKHEVYSSWYSGQSSWALAFSPENPPLLITGTDGQTAVDSGSRTALNQGGSVLLRNTPGYTPLTNQFRGEARDWGLSSDHPGLVVHSFADGHAKAIPDSVDATLYFRLVTRAGHETVDQSQM